MSRKRSYFRPDGEVRRSQLLTSAGPGALVDLIKYAVVVKGLDDWRYDNEKEGFVEEERLQSKALRMLKATGEWKHDHVRLRRPPICEDDDASPNRGIRAREFPRWYLCQNPKCSSLIQRTALDEHREHKCVRSDVDPKTKKKVNTFPAVPIRFVAACARGHLMDINWRRFVHKGEREEGVDPEGSLYCQLDTERELSGEPLGDDWAADLFLKPVGTSGDITDYIVGCRRCGKNRGLQDLVGKFALGTCQGWRPWLGRGSNEEGCEQDLRLLIRTGTNAYFPQTMSVLSIPDTSDTLRKIVGRHWGTLKKVDDIDELRFFVKKVEDLAKDVDPFDLEDVMTEIERKRSDAPVESVPIREAEWRELMKAPPELSGDLPPRGSQWWPRRLEAEVPGFIDRVVLVHAMREVRAQVAFTRLEGFNTDAEGEYQLADQSSAMLSMDQDWIPSIEVRGEGVFIAFNEKAVRKWEGRKAVRDVAERFREGLRQELGVPKLDLFGEAMVSPRLLMLHSVAHMLITAISLECGYSASAIRERIYCRRAPGNGPDALAASRAGILLYTGTPGSEGTLGGLVEVGRDIVKHLERAVEMNLLCSNDPVCAQHDPAGAEEGRNREGAACHGCLLIAEPSCERRNRDLDRTLVVPTVENPDAAFLGKWVDELGLVGA